MSEDKIIKMPVGLGGKMRLLRLRGKQAEPEVATKDEAEIFLDYKTVQRVLMATDIWKAFSARFPNSDGCQIQMKIENGKVTGVILRSVRMKDYQ